MTDTLLPLSYHFVTTATMHATARLSNALVRSHHEVLTLTEHRILLNALRCIHTSDTTLPPFAFRMVDVLDRVNGKARELLHDAVRKLKNRQFDGDTLFETLEANDATKTIQGTFNPEMTDHLLFHKMKEHGYAQVDLSDTQFTSIHAYRLFWLLSSHRPGAKLTYHLDEFRYLVLGDRDKYAVWQNLKRHVLRLVSDQFEEAGYGKLHYQERQPGKSIVSLTITVPDLRHPAPAPAPVVAPASAPVTAPAPLENNFVDKIRHHPVFFDLYTRLVDRFKITKSMAENILRWVNKPDFRQRFQLVSDTLQKVNEHAGRPDAKITNIGVYTLTVLQKAKNTYEAQVAEQQEKQENRRDNSPAQNHIAAALAANFKA